MVNQLKNLISTSKDEKELNESLTNLDIILKEMEEILPTQQPKPKFDDAQTQQTPQQNKGVLVMDTSGRYVTISQEAVAYIQATPSQCKVALQTPQSAMQNMPVSTQGMKPEQTQNPNAALAGVKSMMSMMGRMMMFQYGFRIVGSGISMAMGLAKHSMGVAVEATGMPWYILSAGLVGGVGACYFIYNKKLKYSKYSKRVKEAGTVQESIEFEDYISNLFAPNSISKILTEGTSTPDDVQNYVNKGLGVCASYSDALRTLNVDNKFINVFVRLSTSLLKSCTYSLVKTKGYIPTQEIQNG